jgi:hypothetical protein
MELANLLHVARQLIQRRTSKCFRGLSGLQWSSWAPGWSVERYFGDLPTNTSTFAINRSECADPKQRLRHSPPDGLNDAVVSRIAPATASVLACGLGPRGQVQVRLAPSNGAKP